MPELKKKDLGDYLVATNFIAEKTVMTRLRAIQVHTAGVNSTDNVSNQISDSNFSIFLPYRQYIFLVSMEAKRKKK